MACEQKPRTVSRPVSSAPLSPLPCDLKREQVKPAVRPSFPAVTLVSFNQTRNRQARRAVERGDKITTKRCFLFVQTPLTKPSFMRA